MKVLCIVIFFNTLHHIGICSDEECMKWAIQRIIGPSYLNLTDELQHRVGLLADQEGPQPQRAISRGAKPGKQGPVGPQGAQGPPGPPGTCDCVPDELIALQRENEDLREKLERIRKVSPETYCLLGVKSGSIPLDAISTSSQQSRIQYLPLDSGESWHSSSLNPGTEWVMADLGTLKRVTGIVTQGRPAHGQWVKTYKVEHSVNGTKFIDIKKSDGSEKVFNANTDQNTKVINRFPEAVIARFIRIYPLSYSSYMSMRFDLIDC